MPDHCCPDQLVAEWQSHLETASEPLVGDLDYPAVRLDDAARDGQPVPAAVIRRRCVRAVLPRKAVSKTRGRSSSGMPPHASETVKETASTGSLLTWR